MWYIFHVIIPSYLFCQSGGEDFDQRVMEHFLKLYKKKTGKDVRKDNRAVQKLRREVEKAKRALSSQHQARVEIESFFDGEDFSETLTRAKFEELNMVSAIHFIIGPGQRGADLSTNLWSLKGLLGGGGTQLILPSLRGLRK